MGSCPLGKSSMSEIVAFDTNVLLYAVDRHEPGKRDRALDLIARSDGAVMLWQVAIEFIAASRKLAAQGMTPQEAWDQRCGSIWRPCRSFCPRAPFSIERRTCT